MARENPTRTPNGIMTFLGGVALLAIFIAIMVAWIQAHRPINTIEVKRADARKTARVDLDKKASEQLNSLGWVDKAKNVAHIPIDQAIPLIISEYGTKQAKASSVKVDPPMPLPPPPALGEAPVPAFPSAPGGADIVGFSFPEASAPVAPAATPAPVAPAVVPASVAPAVVPAPVAPAVVPAPVAPAAVHAPVAPAAVHAPVAPAAVHAPVAPAAVHAPVAPAAVHAPVAPAAVHAPVAPAAVHAPVAPAPAETTPAPAPKGQPDAPAPAPAP